MTHTFISPDAAAIAKMDIPLAYATPGYVDRAMKIGAINSFIQAKAKAHALMRKYRDAPSFTTVCQRANDDVEVIRFNRNGSRRVLWSFSAGMVGSRFEQEAV